MTIVDPVIDQGDADSLQTHIEGGEDEAGLPSVAWLSGVGMISQTEYDSVERKEGDGFCRGIRRCPTPTVCPAQSTFAIFIVKTEDN